MFQTCKDTKFESNSQPDTDGLFLTLDCFRRAKIQNLRAIHNAIFRVTFAAAIVSDVQRYKIWEQFTTSNTLCRRTISLFQTCKDTKFESNSQHCRQWWHIRGYCFRRAKIQNLRAIHNSSFTPSPFGVLFQTCKDTKFESNSQLVNRSIEHSHDCFRRAKIQNLRAIHNWKETEKERIFIVSDVQRYKIWEQFTTQPDISQVSPTLFQTCKDTKFESNSQQSLIYIYPCLNCFRRAKIQNLRAIHNSRNSLIAFVAIVSDVQRYKIWEQFTTGFLMIVGYKQLFQTCKDTKFESNSQLSAAAFYHIVNCFRRAKIQNLRAIHNPYEIEHIYPDIVSDVQRYKIWEQFTTIRRKPPRHAALFQTCKDTKFESNSQQKIHCKSKDKNCFRRAKIQNLRAIHN